MQHTDLLPHCRIITSHADWPRRSRHDPSQTDKRFLSDDHSAAPSNVTNHPLTNSATLSYTIPWKERLLHAACVLLHTVYLSLYPLSHRHTFYLVALRSRALLSLWAVFRYGDLTPRWGISLFLILTVACIRVEQQVERQQESSYFLRLHLCISITAWFLKKHWTQSLQRLRLETI